MSDRAGVPGAAAGYPTGMGRLAALSAAGLAAALAVRVAHARHERILHPDGRSFTGELTVWGGPGRTGSALLDDPGRYEVTVRISKGAGTAPGRPDLLGVAVRVHGPQPGRRRDLLYSTAGRGRLTRHVPTPRAAFDTRYGSILAYRTAAGRTVHLTAEPDPDRAPLGRSLEDVTAAAARGAALLLGVSGVDPRPHPVARVVLGDPLDAAADAALAFDPVRNTDADLHPTGLVHASRAWAYRAGQRWRGARPAAPDPAAVTRTATHR